ncbi:kelch-like protein 30 [Styela clava]
MPIDLSCEEYDNYELACDFMIKVDEESFLVHQNILVSSSDYFKALFRSGMIETLQGYIDMKESNSDAVKQCIGFMYTGEAIITLENVENILHEATLMEITRLTSLCSIFLRENLDRENCIQFREITQKYDCECDKFIRNYIARKLNYMLCNNPELLLLASKFNFEQYLEASKLDCSSKWKAVKLWIEGNAENEETVQTHLNDLMDVSQYPVDFLLDRILEDSLVQSCKQVHKMVAEAVFKDVEKLSKLISKWNCIYIKNLVREYFPTNMTDTNEAADKYIREHFDEFSDREDFEELSTEEGFAFFVHPDTKFRSEKHKIEVAMNWTKQNESGRKGCLFRFFKTIDMERLSTDFIQDIFKFEPLVKNSPEVRDFLLEHSLSRHDQRPSFPQRSQIALFIRNTGEIKLFDPDTNTIAHLTEVYQQRYTDIVSVDGELFMVRDKKIFRYQEGKSWTEIAEMQKEWSSFGKVLNFQNQIYIIECHRMVRYDTRKNILYINLAGCALWLNFSTAATDKYIYALNEIDDATKYDPDNETWEPISPLENLVVVYTTFVVENKFYVLGRSRRRYCDVVSRYDPENNSWAEVTTSWGYHSNCSACVVGNRVYLITSNEFVKSIEMYNVETNVWTTLCDHDLGLVAISACTYEHRTRDEAE